MDQRQQRGLELVRTGAIRCDGSIWIVPSQSGKGSYRVALDGESSRCTCPDYETWGRRCKHIHAAEYALRGEVSSNGQAAPIEPTKKPTYKQNWSAYNIAKCEEKKRFVVLLADLCGGVPQPPRRPGAGRSPLPLSDMVFAAAYKVYVGFSSRRFTTDLRDAFISGFINTTPHFNSVSNYMVKPELTDILAALVTTSSLPLKTVETDFAVDSSGFSTSRFVRWFNKKYGRETDNREWIKAHLICGVQTKIVTGVEVSGWMAHDTNYFVPLLERTAAHFGVERVSADKAYLSHKNAQAVKRVGATPFIPFKSNTVLPAEDSAWSRMYHYFMFNRETFAEYYHKRSNIESVFSMIKTNFGDSVRSKSDTGQINEALCKVLCHNICVLVQAIHELGIEPNFCAESSFAQKLAD